MSIRYRLAGMCIIVALLPAIPLSILVSNLLEKSFNVGLSETMESALDSGIIVSRKHLETLHAGFEEDTGRLVALSSGDIGDSSRVSALMAKSAGPSPIDGFFVTDTAHLKVFKNTDPPLPPELAGHSVRLAGTGLVEGTMVIERTGSPAAGPDLKFYETESRTAQFALWTPRGGHVSWLFYKRTNPEFIAHAGNLLEGRQLFAQLRLAQERLSRSFFYPFIIIYAVMLVISLLLAFYMSERLAGPLRRLVGATSAVADGDWHINLKEKADGEIGHLVDGFNHMVGRLDTQRRRLIDLEKMAAWREMGRHLAHEIKNPILPIRLTVQEMRDQYKGGDRAYNEMLSDSVRVVEDELAHLQRLVKEFSSFARMPGLSVASASMDRLVRDVAKLYPQAEVTIDAGAGPGHEAGLPQLVFDPDQMRRVLINLFDNALSVLPPDTQGKIRVRMRTEHGGEREAMVLEFTDNGPGIPPENIARVFDPYFTTRTGGTGLGLSMVKNIILLHGGTIEAMSPEGEGATFTIILPVEGPPESGGVS
ncbi:PAS domain-containing sensor histidine kinase [Candidatus Eisenbacteria bacterium]|uniref:histidine kinase n=1 Tax=Eiseniibacteriota bacterium TaxID=2212470 RepID=A0ABV6YMT9_UNCEI